VAQQPANPKLYAMIVAQAKAKYATYPSPGASRWVHQQYVQHGGQFIEGSEKTKQTKMLKRQFDLKKRRHLEKKDDEKKGGKQSGKGKR
jgi:hypothetical protein